MPEGVEKPAEAAGPKKGKAGLIIGVIIAAVTLIGGSVAGAVLGPKLLGGSDDGHGTDEKNDATGARVADEKRAPERIVTAEIPAVVADLRDPDGRIRHVKVGLTAELADKVSVEEFRLVIPRGREAALTYVRSLAFEDVADPRHFLAIKAELSKRVTKEVGEERVHRMMLTDFVLQ